MAGTTWTPSAARRRKITIQSESSSTTTLGFMGAGGTWNAVATEWAAVKVRQQTTLVQVGASQQPVIVATYIVNIRYVPSITILRGMRVVEADGGATYLIQQVQDVDERHRELNLFCSQVPAPTQQTQ